jgi:hypothetical protein
MRLKGIEARIRRLERLTGCDECEGCRITLLKRLACDLEEAMEHPERDHCPIQDWSGTELACCPECGSPDPKMTRRQSSRLWVELAEKRELTEKRDGSDD